MSLNTKVPCQKNKKGVSLKWNTPYINLATLLVGNYGCFFLCLGNKIFNHT